MPGRFTQLVCSAAAPIRQQLKIIENCPICLCKLMLEHNLNASSALIQNKGLMLDSLCFFFTFLGHLHLWLRKHFCICNVQPPQQDLCFLSYPFSLRFPSLYLCSQCEWILISGISMTVYRRLCVLHAARYRYATFRGWLWFINQNLGRTWFCTVSLLRYFCP